MIIARSAEAKSFVAPEPHHREIKVLISPSLQDGVEGISVGMTILPPGNTTSFHEHESEIEAWLVVEGTGEVIVGEERQPAGPETVIFIPPKNKHQMVNTGDKTLRMFWVYAPPGAEKSVLEGLMR